MTTLKVEVKGLDKVMSKLSKFPREIAKYMGQAGSEAAKDVILPTQGLQKYPPETAANLPPVPYYIRGTGTQTASRNYQNSERMQEQWYVPRTGFRTRIENRASYARWVHGDEQARAMARIGWRKLFDVAKDKLGDIQKVYQGWINKLIKDLDL